MTTTPETTIPTPETTIPAPDTTVAVPEAPIYTAAAWCDPSTPYPASYEAAQAQDPTQCLAEDPCSADGLTTLWSIADCPGRPTYSGPAANVADIPVPLVGANLPATGGSNADGMVVAGGLFILVGALLAIATRGHRAA